MILEKKSIERIEKKKEREISVKADVLDCMKNSRKVDRALT